MSRYIRPDIRSTTKFAANCGLKGETRRVLAINLEVAQVLLSLVHAIFELSICGCRIPLARLAGPKTTTIGN